MESHIYKETEELFLKSGIYFREVIENADGVPFQLIFGARMGEGFYINIGSGLNQLLGIAPEYLTERYYNNMIEEIVPLSDDIPNDPVIIREKFINGDIKNFKAEVLVRTMGGEKKWIRESSLPMIDEFTGKVIGSFGILFDISRRKLVVNQSMKVQAKREDDELLKEAFLHNISHEIRTPLNAIVGFSALLNEVGNGREQRQEYLDIITRSTDHLLEVINDIVDISKIESNNITISEKEINLNSLLHKVYNKFSSKAGEKNLQLCLEMPPYDNGDLIILTDECKLLYVLNNIVGNAVKFTGKGKVIFGYHFKNYKIEFYVSDTGIGIPLQCQSRIFDRFYQVDSSSTRSYDGTGLGLTISKAYIEMLGGSIWFTSLPEKGSVFYFTIPI